MVGAIMHPNTSEVVIRELEDDPRVVEPSLWMPQATLVYKTFYRREALVFDGEPRVLTGEEHDVSRPTFVGSFRIHTRKAVALLPWSRRRRAMLRIMNENGVNRVATWREYPYVILPVPDDAIIEAG